MKNLHHSFRSCPDRGYSSPSPASSSQPLQKQKQTCELFKYFEDTKRLSSQVAAAVAMETLLPPWWRSWACAARGRPFPWTPAPGAASSPGSAWPGSGSPASPRPRCPRPTRTPRLAPSAPPPSPAPPVSAMQNGNLINIRRHS